MNENKTQLQKELDDFDLSPLWQEDEESGGFAKFIPWINLALEIVILLVIIFKK